MKNITADEVIAAGGCPMGIRQWFRANAERLPEGYDMRAFLRDGMSVDLAVSLNDPFLNRVLTNRVLRHE